MSQINLANPTLWRSLEELEASPEFEDYLHREFPKEASVWDTLEDPLSRRRFLEVMGASFMLSVILAGASSCTKMPAEKIIPYITPPESFVPGQKKFYATSSLLNGFAKGILVESHDGRPTKIEGNPLHTASLGATDIFAQAEILSLYDPDRSQEVSYLGETSHWDAFAEDVSARVPIWTQDRGDGMVILTEQITSPTLIHQIRCVLKTYPKAKWYSYDPLRSSLSHQASIAVFGKTLTPLYHLERTKVVLSLGADFLGNSPAQQAYARAYISSRKNSSRLYMLDSSITLTGACADERLPLRPSEIGEVTRALAKKLGIAVESDLRDHSDWIETTALKLLERPDQSLVIAGVEQNLDTQILAHAMNKKLGNDSKTVDYIQAVEEIPSGNLDDFHHALEQGRIKSIFILGGNPAYNLPARNFAPLLSKVDFRVRLGLQEDETSKLCQWHLPEAHFLEAWGDARAYDGTLSFQQPLIEPLYGGKSATEVLAFLLSQSGKSSRQILQEHWNSKSETLFSDQAIQAGFVSNSQSRYISTEVKANWTKALSPSENKASEKTFELALRADPTIGDGRYANNGWLQELPKPVLQLTWGNAALLAPATARELHLTDGDLIQIKHEDRSTEAPVLRVPGHPLNSVTLHLGAGRMNAGRVANGIGVNAYPLMSAPHKFDYKNVAIRRVGKREELATTHFHSNMEGRNLVIRGVVPEEARSPEPTMLEDYPSPGEAWAMVIDLEACIGCNACTIACQAENNIPVVGKDQVRRSREMHWIRVDRYYEGSPENPRVYFQPVPCMQCEKAPCEEVCPTAATNHSSDGLNQMVYNRCVGTRYCSNNCPYKVRRFNFLEYNDFKSSLAKLMHNPDVTVRSRGVMEKCTYCIQRIQEVRIGAEREDRKIRDGEIVTACEAACPTVAITFGDQNDPDSRVSALKKKPSNYSLLNELGTKPRTTYLAMQERL